MGNFLIRPGTLLLILVIGLVLFGLFNWASDTFSQTEEQSLENQENAIRCSNLNIDIIEGSRNSTHEVVYIQANQPIDSLLVEFEGSGNHTELIENVEKSSIVEASAPMETVKRVRVRVSGCNRVFS